MQKYNDWDKTQAASGEAQTLPAGNYICKIKGAKVVTYDGKNGKFDKLEISVDIDEGEFKGFYANDYRNQAQWGDQKWKGCLRPYCPTNEDSDQARRTAAIFKGIIEAIESSNPGYKWNWDETTLKGKKVGVRFRNTEWAYNGHTGWKTQPYRFVPVNGIEELDIPKEKPLAVNDKPQAQTENNNFQDLPDEGDLPF